MERAILLLGDPRLYEKSAEVQRGELDALRPLVRDLHDTLQAFRRRGQGSGREYYAIAAPQIGVAKRVIYQYTDKPVIYINPFWQPVGEAGEQQESAESCASFPGLFVRTRRFARVRLRFRDLGFQNDTAELSGSLAAALQHAADHLEGFLATQRAADPKDLFLAGAMGGH